MSGISCVPAAKRTECVAVGALAVANGQPEHGAIIRSQNGGESWRRRGAPTGVGALAYVACSGSSFCMADGQALGGVQSVLISSTNGGVSWVRDHLPSNVRQYLLAGPISCVAEKCWIEGESHRLLFTRDGGKSFSTQLLPQATCCVQTSVANVTFVNASDGYATGSAGGSGLAQSSFEGLVWRTIDGGAHWTMVTLGATSVLAISCVDPSHCWAAASTPGPYASLTGTMYGTADGGATWSRQSLPRFRGSFNDLRCLRAARADRCFAAGENLDENGPIMVSTVDGGSHWRLDREPKRTGPLRQVAFVGTAGRAAGQESNASASGLILASA